MDLKAFIKKNSKILIIVLIVFIIILIPLLFKLVKYLQRRSAQNKAYDVFDVVRDAYSDIQFGRSNLKEGLDYTVDGNVYTFNLSSLETKNVKNKNIRINADLNKGTVYVDLENAIRFTNSNYYCYGSSEDKALTCLEDK